MTLFPPPHYFETIQAKQSAASEIYEKKAVL